MRYHIKHTKSGAQAHTHSIFFTRNISHAHKHKTRHRGAHTHSKYFTPFWSFVPHSLPSCPNNKPKKHQTNRTLGRTTDGSGKRKVHGWLTTGEKWSTGMYTTSFRMHKTRVWRIENAAEIISVAAEIMMIIWVCRNLWPPSSPENTSGWCSREIKTSF